MSFQLPIKLKISTAATTEDLADAFVKSQDNVSKSFTFFNKKTFLDAHIETKVSLVQGLNLVPHRLSRILTGWEIVRLRGYSIFQDFNDTGTAPGLYLYLMASDPCIVDILVF